jgi:hypothetical protein
MACKLRNVLSNGSGLLGVPSDAAWTERPILEWGIINLRLE